MLRPTIVVLVAGLAALATGAAPAAATPVVRSFSAGPAAPFHLPSGMAFDPAPGGVRDPCATWERPPSVSTDVVAEADLCAAATFELGVEATAPAQVSVALPPGLVLTAGGRPLCDANSTDDATCAVASRVGTLALRWKTTFGTELESSGPVSVTAGGLLARVPVAPDGSIVRTVPLTVATDGQGAVTLGVGTLPTELPSDQGPQQVTLTGLALRLWGSTAAHPGMPQPYLALTRRCTEELFTTLTARTGVLDAPAAAVSRYTPTGCPASTSTLASTATTTVGGALPTVVPYFGTQRSRGGGPQLGVLRSVYLTGLPAGTTVAIRCTAGCGRRTRALSLVIGEQGSIQRRVQPGWPIFRSTRLSVVASATGAVPSGARYRFVLQRRVVRAQRIVR